MTQSMEAEPPLIADPNRGKGLSQNGKPFFQSTGVGRPVFAGRPDHRPAGTTGRPFWAAQGRPGVSPVDRQAGRPPVDPPADLPIRPAYPARSTGSIFLFRPCGPMAPSPAKTMVPSHKRPFEDFVREAPRSGAPF